MVWENGVENQQTRERPGQRPRGVGRLRESRPSSHSESDVRPSVCVCTHTGDVEEDMVSYCGKSTWCEAFNERPPRLDPALQATGN